MSEQTLSGCCQSTSTDTTREHTMRLRPSIDLLEGDGYFLMHVDMPGVAPDHVDVSIEKHVLSIKGTADYPVPGGGQLLAGQPGKRNYERSFRLSDDIDQERIDAEVSNGVLTLRLPKSHRAQKTSIPVKGT